MVRDGRQRAVLLHLPTNPEIDIEFKDITFTVPLGIRRGKRRILNSISGKFKSGELTAIMGPSGAGKSSLLNILTGFHTTGMGGQISINNMRTSDLGAREYRKESCYILQDDQLLPYFTVMENMHMAADLKLGSSVTDKAKQLIIDDILETLGLQKCAMTKCDRLSGGQKKRLSIALELIDNPPIMFLDEPTTGLDSSSSLQCVSMLKALARGGRTIICTIHQPSASIYEQFDQVYVINQGHCVYQGTSYNTVPYLQSYGFNCPKYHNPADYLLEIANGDYGNFLDIMRQNAKTTEWLHQLPIESKEQIVESNNRYNSINEKKLEIPKSMVLISPPSELSKFFVLLSRNTSQTYRDWTVSHLKFGLHTLVGIIIGIFYYQFGNDGSKSLSNVGYFIMTLVYLCYTAMMPAVLKFPLELPVLKKERFNNWYSLKTYYFAFMIADIPCQLVFTFAFVSISYYLSGQPQDMFRFLMYLGISILTSLTSQSFGLVLGTTVNPVNGTFFGAIATAIMLLFAGFLVLFNHMPRIMYWVSYLTYLRYGYEGLVQAVYGYDRPELGCPEKELYCHYRYPQMVLEELSMTQDRYWFNFTVLALNLVMLRIVAYFSLRRRLST